MSIERVMSGRKREAKGVDSGDRKDHRRGKEVSDKDPGHYLNGCASEKQVLLSLSYFSQVVDQIGNTGMKLGSVPFH